MLLLLPKIYAIIIIFRLLMPRRIFCLFFLSLTHSLLINHSPNECLNFEFSFYSLNFLVFFCNASTRFNYYFYYYYYYYRTCIHTHIECLELPLIHASAAATNSFDLNNLSSEAVVNLNAIYTFDSIFPSFSSSPSIFFASLELFFEYF